MLRNPSPQVEPLSDLSGNRRSSEGGDYVSQAFELWLEGMGEPDKRHILDLGPGRSSTINYLARQPTRLFVADLREDLPLHVPEMDDESSEERADLERRALHHVLPDVPDESQHGVLCWDLLNYLSPPQLALMGEWLYRKLRVDGVVLVALLRGRDMPSRPGVYEIRDDTTLRMTHDSGGTSPCPGYNQADFDRRWSGFQVSRSYLMRDERQEFILRRR